jgi:hypothetical protein
MVTSIITLKKHGGMVKNLNPQCGGEGFKSSHLQTCCTRLLGYLIRLGIGSYPKFIFP